MNVNQLSKKTMAITNREIKLSAELMELQSQYNDLKKDNERTRSMLKGSMESGKLLVEAVERLEDTISILRSVSKKSTSDATKKFSTQK